MGSVSFTGYPVKLRPTGDLTVAGTVGGNSDPVAAGGGAVDFFEHSKLLSNKKRKHSPALKISFCIILFYSSVKSLAFGLRKES